MREAFGFTKKQKKTAAFLMIVIISLSYLTYSMVIPRVSLTANTTVHYSYSGISMGFTIKNSGTLDITDLRMNVTVIDENGDVEYSEQVDFGPLSRGVKTVHSFTFTAPQRDRYEVYMHFDFRCEGQEYNETTDHIMKDYMNFNWEDEFSEWRL
jgi:hypothetical protein